MKGANFMNNEQKSDRLVWTRPEVKRIDAQAAEGASGTGGDNVVFS